MNHEQVIEILPWLLNGTLDEGESQAVREHLAACESCRRALHDTRLALRVFDQHLPAEALVALAWNSELPAGLDAAVVESHLRSCPQCAADLELARTSRRLEEDGRIAVFPHSAAVKPAPARSSEDRSSGRGWRSAALAAGLAGVIAASGWLNSAGRIQTLEEQLAKRAPAPVSAPAPVPAPTPAPAPPIRDDGGAAEMAAVIEGLMKQVEAQAKQVEAQAMKVRELESSRAAGSAGAVNAQYAELRLVGDVVRGDDGGRPVPEVAAGSPAYTFTVPAEHAETHREHRVVIADESGKTVWSADGLRRDLEFDEYTFLVPQPLKPGLYTVTILAPDGAKLEQARVRATGA